ncbi:preprotein translocase SecA family protein [Actinidia rufa]|uniref:Preprotein translocase SecA family protein n=1 Tax=Actinidia rufa TaxID=165716 RepID=A0A7J0DL94_9ERIC|nr:preprotein translocase SecA family protein [Actinidia rufa]
MDLLEPPECPVCLQPYDGASATPRVLACGHSACETCLSLLPQPFPHTIRCPACTQLVKCSHPQSLPKNIDLLRFASLFSNPDPQNPKKPNEKQSIPITDRQFVPNLWSNEFYLTWKDWIVPEDALEVEFGSDDGFCCVSRGRIVGFSGSWGLSARCLLKGREEVSLVRVGGSLCENNSKLKYSYVAKILRFLCGMRDGERDELGLILKASNSRRSQIGKVYGLWCKSDDQGVYLVCERYGGSFLEKFADWRNGFVKDYLVVCLAMNCFGFDDFGHVHIDFNEALVMSRNVRWIIAEAILKKEEFQFSSRSDALETLAFVSPELLFELLQTDATDLDCGAMFAVGYGSDVWSLACVLLWLLIGEPFTDLMCNYLHCLVQLPSDENGSDYSGLYMNWMEKLRTTLETKMISEFVSLREILCGCLNYDPGSRPTVIDVWKCIRELVIKPKFDIMVSLPRVVNDNKEHCLFLRELCQLQKKTNKTLERQLVNGLQEKDDNGREDVDQDGEVRMDGDLVEGLSGGHVKCIDFKGHLDCITGLAVGGGFLFSSSFDKTVHVWSLQDFTHVHKFIGHEHKVMAVVYADEEQPLCISGDSGGGIFIWGISNPFGQAPIKKLYEQKDWRYSGIHALAISGNGYLYTGSGDKSIKAWSLKDYTLSCTMNGHKSVVSTLAVCNGVLYSGSWDGTIRLWCLTDHSPLTVLGEDAPGNLASVLSLAAYGDALVVAHENGCLKASIL